MNKILLPLLLLAQLAIAQQPKVVGYLPTYRFSWLNDIEFERLTHVNIAFANPDSSGNLSCGANIDPAIAIAHDQACQVFISLAGGYLTPNQDDTWNYLAQPANRPAYIQKIVQYVQAHDLDGVDVDLEWQYVKDWYSPFILDLKAALSPLGLKLTAALPGNYRYPKITNPALAAFDWVNMMVYDLRGPWDPSNPGQHSPYNWAVDCIAYWKNQGVQGSKLTLGLPFYGYDFGVSPVASFNYRGIVNINPANAYLDESGQKFWNGIPTIKAKTALALNEVSGVMIWEIGQDAFGANAPYSLLRAIDEVIDAGVSATNAPNLAQIHVFPNPAQQWLTVALGENQAGARLRIVDVQGRVWQEVAAESSELAVLNVQDLPVGLYVLTVLTDGDIKTGKFVKE